MEPGRRTFQEHWDLILFGAVAVGLVCSALVLSSGGPSLFNPSNVWVFVLVLTGTKAAVLVPGLLFLGLNCCLFIGRRAKTTAAQLRGSGALIAAVFCFSILYYIVSWKYRGVHTPAGLYDGWLLISLVLAAATAGLFYWGVRSRKPEALILTYAMLFVWFFSYAFPSIGERL